MSAGSVRRENCVPRCVPWAQEEGPAADTKCTGPAVFAQRPTHLHTARRSWLFAASPERDPDGLRPAPHPGQGGNTMFLWNSPCGGKKTPGRWPSSCCRRRPRFVPRRLRARVQCERSQQGSAEQVQETWLRGQRLSARGWDQALALRSPVQSVQSRAETCKCSGTGLRGRCCSVALAHGQGALW